MWAYFILSTAGYLYLCHVANFIFCHAVVALAQVFRHHRKKRRGLSPQRLKNGMSDARLNRSTFRPVPPPRRGPRSGLTEESAPVRAAGGIHSHISPPGLDVRID